MTQPAAPFTPRQLVRAVPFSSPVGQVAVVGAGASVVATFDCGAAISNRNDLGYTGVGGLVASGFFLDASLFSDQASSLDVQFQITQSTSTSGSLTPPITPTLGTARSVMTGGVPLVVAASTLTLVAGLRVVGVLCIVIFKNTAGVAANMETWAAIRSA